MRSIGFVVVLTALITPLFVTPAHADLFPDIDIIPDPNLEDLNDFPAPDPDYRPGKKGNRHDRDGDGVPDRRDVRPLHPGGNGHKGKIHRRHRDEGKIHRRHRDEDQDAAEEQHEPTEKTVKEPKPKDTGGENKPQQQVETQRTSDQEDGGGIWGYVVALVVLLFLFGAGSRRNR